MKTTELLTRNIVDIIVKTNLEKRLKDGDKLRIKHGVDPTNPRYHIGRAVVLWKLREFQDQGHKIVLIIGDFTATIGDSSDKTSERQPLTRDQVKTNMGEYLDQVGRVLDIKKVEVHHNSEWFDKMSLHDFIKLAEQFTISQMIERENFAIRLADNRPVGLHETLYPLLQGYDSVAINADVEIGGTDQLFNMLAGRTMQRSFKRPEQNVITTPILEGTDGRKMSSSWDNCIYLDESALEMYGHIMSVRDELIPAYFRMATDMPIGQIDAIERNLASGDNPRQTKASLARHIVTRYYGLRESESVERAWNAQFRDGKTPKHIEELHLSVHQKPILLDILNDHFGLSRSEARRVLEQQGVRVNGQVIAEADFSDFQNDTIVQLGKRRLVKIHRK